MSEGKIESVNPLALSAANVFKDRSDGAPAKSRTEPIQVNCVISCPRVFIEDVQ